MTKDKMRWLKDAIIDYIKNTDRVNTLKICSHFKLRHDITFKCIKEMEDSGEITRIDHFAEGWDGHHHYEIKEEKKYEKIFIERK